MAWRRAHPVGFLLLAAFVLIPAGVSFAGNAEIPRRPMPPEVRGILREAIKSFTFREHMRKEYLRKNLDALDELGALPWPDMRGLERVHIYSLEKPAHFMNVWRAPNGDGALVLLMPDGTERRTEATAYAKVEAFDYADELTELIRYLKERDPAKARPWDFTFINDFGTGRLPYYGGVFLLHHAYAAACLGKPEEARLLTHEALKQRSGVFESVYNEGAWHSFARGIEMLETGVARKKILENWQETLRLYGRSRYADQLRDLTGNLTKQVAEDKRLAAQPAVDPGELPVEERIAWYIARLPDVHGAQWSQPGHCMTTGMGEGTRYSDAIVKIGRPAVPALIDRLDDRRLSRSVGFWRNFSPSRTVLRVQDVAVQCIEAILDVDFYHPSSTSSYLSNEKPEIRNRVIADIRSWWKKNGAKSALEGYKARLGDGPLWRRINTLGKIERIPNHGVDTVSLLKQWSAREPASEQPRIAEALAKRGDLSMLADMRKMMRASNKPPNECVWFVMEYGTAEDYRFLLRATRKDIEAGAKLGSYCLYGAVAGGMRSAKNPLAVPILVDLLDRREITGSRHSAGMDRPMGFSCADTCVGRLILMTGHDEGYKPGDPDRTRYAAIDRWVAWWRREGKAAYLKEHPEVIKVYGDGPSKAQKEKQ